MQAYRVVAPLLDHTTGDVVDRGRLLPRHLADDPAVVARLTAALCLEPVEVAADTPALAEPHAALPAALGVPARRPVRGRKRTIGG